MALKNAYKNKLMGVNNRNSLQNNIQNSAQSVLNDSQNIESGLSNETQAQSTTPNYANNTAVNNYGWQDYASLINAKTTNPKAELQTAMQRAQSASNEYLKALGLAGSGMGQSQLSDIGVQYQNALSKINQTAQDEVNNQLAKDLEDAVANGRYSARDVQDFIRQYGEQTGNTETYKNIAENYGATYEQEADRVAENLQKIIKGEAVKTLNGDEVLATEKQKKYAKILNEKLTQARLNGNQNLYYEILDENSDFLNTLKLPDDNTPQETVNGSSDNYSYSKIKQTIEDLKYLEVIEFPSGYSVKNTGKNKYTIFKDGKSINLGHDYTIDEVLNEIDVE